MKRQWLYKKNVEPTIFTGEEAITEALESGWKDTPAGFDKSKDIIDAKVIEKKKKPIATIEAKVVKSTKKQEKLEDMEREELYEIAKNEGLNVSLKAGKEVLIARIESSRNRG